MLTTSEVSGGVGSLIALVSLSKPKREPAFVYRTSDPVIGIFQLKNKILLVLRSRVLAFQANEGYKEYLVDTGKTAVACAMAPFPGKVDKYGLVVVNKADSKGRCVVDVHNFVDGEYLMHQRCSLDDDGQSTGQFTAAFFGAQRDRLFLFQEHRKVIWEYQWADHARLAFSGATSLLTGLTDSTHIPRVQRLYHIWGNVFLLFFHDGSFKLIDCDVTVKRMMVLRTHLQFDLPNWGLTTAGELDAFSYPQVFVTSILSGMAKPAEFALVG